MNIYIYIYLNINDLNGKIYIKKYIKINIGT